jgi:hypothetical protein
VGYHHFTIFKLLTSQLAWSRRHLAMTTMLTQQRQELENLNWYKHHRLEDLYRLLGKLAQDLAHLQAKDTAIAGELQLLHGQITAVMKNSEAVLVGERWQLHRQHQTMPLISLLNRLIERVNPILEARQLWSKVHNESSVVVGGDMLKLELILYEVVAAACNRSPIGGRIDLWCRVLNLDWVELRSPMTGSARPGCSKNSARASCLTCWPPRLSTAHRGCTWPSAKCSLSSWGVRLASRPSTMAAPTVGFCCP